MYRVTLIVDRPAGGERVFPMPPERTTQRSDGTWAVEFDADGVSFDAAAGQLWGELAACGITVHAVASLAGWPSSPT